MASTHTNAVKGIESLSKSRREHVGYDADRTREISDLMKVQVNQAPCGLDAFKISN